MDATKFDRYADLLSQMFNEYRDIMNTCPAEFKPDAIAMVDIIITALQRNDRLGQLAGKGYIQ